MADVRPSRELFCGDFPALEAALFARLAERRRRDPLAPEFVLVPTNLLRIHLRRAFAEQLGAHVNVRFITFNELVRLLTEPALLERGWATMPMFADELLIAQICDTLPSTSYFAALANRSGMHRALLGAITDLAEGGATPAEFHSALERTNDLHPTTQVKLTSLGAIWHEYTESKRAHGFIDDADAHRIAAAAWTQQPQAGCPPSGIESLTVYGFYDFKMIQWRLILAASEAIPVSVYFPFVNSPAWQYAAPSRSMLLGAGFEEQTLGAASSRTEPLEQLCNRLFTATASESSSVPAGHSHDVPVASEAVEIISVPGETRQYAEVARIAVRLCRQYQIRFHEIGVLPRSAAPLTAIREACETVPLKSYCPTGVSLATSRAGRSFLLMVRMLEDDFARRIVMEFLTFADLDFRTLADDPDPPTAVWDVLSMRANVVQGREQWLTRLNHLRSRLSRAANEARDESTTATPQPSHADRLIRTVTVITDHLDQVRSAKTWTELIERVVAAFQFLIVPSDDRDVVARAVLQLAELAPLKLKPEISTFNRLANELLAAESARLGEFQNNGPVLVSLMQARGVPFRAVIVPDLVERTFPQPPSLDPILLDHERRAINRAFESARGKSRFVPQLPEKQRQVEEERLLFRLAIGSAHEKLVLLYPRLESESGREQLPSHFLLRVIDALPTRPVEETPATVPSSSSEPARSSRSIRTARKRATKEAQLVLPFAASTPEAKLAPDKIPASAPVAIRRETVAPGQMPATFELLARWPRLIRIPLSQLAPDASLAATAREFDLGRALAAIHTDPGLLTAFAALSGHFGRAAMADTVRWTTTEFTRYDGRIEDPELLELLRAKSPLRTSISPRRVEDYGRCPFHFYLHNLLGLEELEEPETLVRADPRTKGTMVHNILCEFLSTMKQQGRLPVDASSLKDLLAIAEVHLREFEASGACGPLLNWRVEREQLHQFFRDFVESEVAWQQQGYRPDRFEIPFGCRPDEIPADLSRDSAELHLPDGQVLRFHGIIDRIDRLEHDQSIYIIDYKGKHPPDPGRDGTGFGRALQLPIYLMGAQEALKPLGQLRASGACYMSYEPGATRVRLPEQTDEAVQRIRYVLQTIADGIHAGVFMQYPRGKACDFCPYTGVCMGIEDTLYAIKQNDPAAAPFIEMKEDKFTLTGGNDS